MLVCHGCSRHVRVEETACPFCGTAVQLEVAPTSARLGAMALVVGLGMLGCTDKAGDDSPSETTSMETGMDTSTGETTTG